MDKALNKGSKIIDEQVDFYDASENVWLDDEDRKKAVDKLLERNKEI